MSLPPTTPKIPQSCYRPIISCMIGNALEWYDFALYAYFATIIGTSFFPSCDKFSTLMSTFGIFAAGFVMRPIGAVLFGYIGDRMGRKKALLWSIYLMAIPTTLIGMLPTYDQIGWAAPMLLTLIRLIQGISMGGEFTGTMVFIIEHSRKGQRGLAGSWAPFSLLVGVLVGSCIAVLISSLLSVQSLYAWGWRLPFLLSALGGVVGLYMRRTLVDPEQFLKIKKDIVAKHSTPLIELFQNHWRAILLVLLVDLTVAVGFFLIVTFIVSYLSAIMGFKESDALLINACSALTFLLVTPFSGWLSDRVGRKPVMLTAAFLFVILSYPLFQGFAEQSFCWALGVHMMLGLMMGMYFAPIPAILSELFPTSVRYSGLSIAHNLSMAIFGGTTPLIVTWLIKLTENNAAPAFYLIFASLMSCVGLLFIRDRFREDLD